jgi:pSer/pThr/pTyr-binding forkhead associated (FHA) protein
MQAAALQAATLQAPQGAGTMVLPSLNALSGSLAGLSVQKPAGGGSATMFFGAATVERFARLILVKGHTQLGTQWRLQAGTTVVGRDDGFVLFPDDQLLSARHFQLEFRGPELWLIPFATLNGVFVRIVKKEHVVAPAEIVAGGERFQVFNPDDAPPILSPTEDGEGTSLLGSAVSRAVAPIALRRLAEDARENEVFYRAQRVVTIGRAQCDICFPKDPYLSVRHVQLTREDAGLFVEDLGSRNGTFSRVLAPRRMQHGDVLLFGEQVVRVELSLTLPRSG